MTLAKQGDEAVLPVDPMCRMAVDAVRSPEQRRYENVVHRFCSDECAQVFDLDPGRYAAGASQAAE